MTEDRVEGLLSAQTTIAHILRNFAQQREQLKKLQEDVTRLHYLVHKLYVIYYSPKPASSCRR